MTGYIERGSAINTAAIHSYLDLGSVNGHTYLEATSKEEHEAPTTPTNLIRTVMFATGISSRCLMEIPFT